MRNLLPLFLDVVGREVLLVGGGPVAAAKLRQLEAAGARVRVVAVGAVPEIESAARDGRIQLVRREFAASDLDGAWLAVAAAPPEINRQVAAAAAPRRLFVNAVDDPANATAYLSGVVRRDAVTIAISTAGEAPALTALVREALEALLPDNVGEWMRIAKEQRARWRRDAVPVDRRKPLLLAALNERYGGIPWLAAPEDSWL